MITDKDKYGYTAFYGDWKSKGVTVGLLRTLEHFIRRLSGKQRPDRASVSGERWEFGRNPTELMVAGPRAHRTDDGNSSVESLRESTWSCSDVWDRVEGTKPIYIH